MCIIKKTVDSLISVNFVKHQKFNQVYFCYDHMNIVIVTNYHLQSEISIWTMSHEEEAIWKQ